MAKPISRFDVFIPGDFPEYSYVNRMFINLRTKMPRDPEGEVSEAFQQKGIVLLIAGPSKSGKTIALEHVVSPQRLVKIFGSRITSADSLWQAIVTQMKIPLRQVATIKDSTKNARELGVNAKANLQILEAGGSVKSNHEDVHEDGYQVSFDDDVFNLATNSLIEQDKVLFIDDFHTMNKELLKDVSAQIKAASEIGVKICLAEVPHTADAPINANPDLTCRVQKVVFEYWSKQDLLKIGKLGFKKLNVELSDASLVTLAGEAGGSPQLMQLLCLEAAKVLKIEHELKTFSKVSLSINEINTVFVNVVQKVEREAIFNILNNGPDTRGKDRNTYKTQVLGDADNYEIVLAAIALNPHRDNFLWDQGDDSLSSRIAKICLNENDRPLREQISKSLAQMVKLSVKDMPSQPILDWDEKKGLHILDPYFLFYLRWSEKYMAVREAIRT